MTESGQMAPGWYYATGDPAGTQRYWDGAQWQGGPQPVAAGPGGAGAGPTKPPSEYGPRIVAALIDFGIPFGLIMAGLIVGVIVGSVVDFLGALVVLVAYLGAFGFSIYNQLYLQGTTGQTIGKKQQGLALLSDQTGEPVGLGMVFVRMLLSGVLTQICLLDVIWIFVDEENRRLSDKILTFNVRQV